MSGSLIGMPGVRISQEFTYRIIFNHIEYYSQTYYKFRDCRRAMRAKEIELLGYNLNHSENRVIFKNNKRMTIEDIIDYYIQTC